MHRFEHQGLLGTVIDVRIGASEDAATEADHRIVAEITRLEAIFSAFDPSSELSRWQRGELAQPSRPFCEVMAATLHWQERSAGRFNPLIGLLTDEWRQAERGGRLPPAERLAEVVSSIGAPRFHLVDGNPVATGDVSGLNLNAIAKGFIVDRSSAAAAGCGVESVLVNAGGDLRHWGCEPVPVAIENPHRPYDNEPPLARIHIHNAAVATSGNARRGFRVGQRWFGHVIDPSTGQPVTDTASITVVAPSALVADALTTTAGVLAPADAIAYLNGMHGADGLVVAEDGTVLVTEGWATYQIS